MPRLLLLDGNSLAYRAFFALPTDMATASGQVTNAVFGFTSMLVNLLKDHRPDGMAVAFDRPEPTFRHAVVSDYKAGRPETPDILRQQMGLVRRVVEVLAIPVVEAPGYEADDVIATLATLARERDDEVIVVTGDRDAYQLVEDPWVKVLYNRRGVSDYVLYDEAGIEARTGVRPESYIEYAALRGDPSDNLPGVPGVGEKTAARLVNTYGSLDAIFDHLDQLTPKLRQSLAEHEASTRRNATVIPLVRDVALDVDPDELRMGGWDSEAVRALFDFLEFRTLWDRLVEAVGEKGEALVGPSEPATVVLDVVLDRVASVHDARAALAGLAGAPPGGLDPAPIALEAAWAGQPGRSDLTGLALAGGGDPAGGDLGEGRSAGDTRVPVVWLSSGLLAEPGVALVLSQLVGMGGAPVTAHRAKELARGLAELGVDLTGLDLDTAVAAYLVDPAGGLYLLEDLAARYAGVDVTGPNSAPPGQLDLDGESPDAAEVASRRAAAIGRLAAPLAAALDARQLTRLYTEVERPLVRVLARMETVGVRVDADYLRGLVTALTAEARQLDTEIQELAGEPFRVNSTPQLRAVLYDKLGLAPRKRTKTGYSTDAGSLERLRGTHPIIEALLRYREVEKLRSTYGLSLLAEIGPDGRIHASFNQTVARTGRLSSEHPNLHNIPVRSEEGRQLRRAFIPGEGCEFLVADYDQVELRVIAHLASDPGLIEAFETGRDIHNTTAARLFGVAPEAVTSAQRSKAKMVSYGLAYGMEAYGLSQRLDIPVEEAAVILDAYFVAFPSVRAYMEATVAEARTKGYTETLLGRRRLIPELASSNYRVRQAGERQAMNAGIQGLAADLFKVALVRLDDALASEGLASRLILQVHDEVILEVPPNERQRAAELTREAMEGAAQLRVPLAVALSWGPTWADAKG
ncbi:MAG: DNA polymerase I [Acidimicrobiales bacterium]|nr:MAG: DNA polymerase I [Acidimicrobiales bacterium]